MSEPSGITLLERAYPALRSIPAMSEQALDVVREAGAIAITKPQIPIITDHVLHGGMYARTVMVPAGVMIIGVLVKVPTVLIVQGDVRVYIGDDVVELTGYNVLPASAGRKQAFLADTDTWLTMILPTPAKDIEQAERDFTDEFDDLASHRDVDLNYVRITEE